MVVFVCVWGGAVVVFALLTTTVFWRASSDGDVLLPAVPVVWTSAVGGTVLSDRVYGARFRDITRSRRAARGQQRESTSYLTDSLDVSSNALWPSKSQLRAGRERKTIIVIDNNKHNMSFNVDVGWYSRRESETDDSSRLLSPSKIVAFHPVGKPYNISVRWSLDVGGIRINC